MGMNGGNRFSVHDFSQILNLRNPAGYPYLLIGGQAVNYWAERYRHIEPALHEFLPFTSEDIDFKGTRADVKSIADQLGRSPVFPAKVEMTMLAGAISISLGGSKTSIEVVRQVPGVSDSDLELLAVEAEFDKRKIRVMDPVSLTASKLKLGFTVSQEKRQDIKHLKILVVCVRGFLREILALVEAGNIAPGGWLGAVNQMRHLATSNYGKKAAKVHHVDWTQFLPIAEVRAAQDEKIVRFRELQLSRWGEF